MRRRESIVVDYRQSSGGNEAVLRNRRLVLYENSPNLTPAVIQYVLRLLTE